MPFLRKRLLAQRKYNSLIIIQLLPKFELELPISSSALVIITILATLWQLTELYVLYILVYLTVV